MKTIHRNKTDFQIMADKFKKLAPAKQLVVLDKMANLIKTETDAEVKSLFSAVRNFLSGLTETAAGTESLQTDNPRSEFGERHRAEVIGDLEGLKEASDE